MARSRPISHRRRASLLAAVLAAGWPGQARAAEPGAPPAIAPPAEPGRGREALNRHLLNLANARRRPGALTLPIPPPPPPVPAPAPPPPPERLLATAPEPLGPPPPAAGPPPAPSPAPVSAIPRVQAAPARQLVPPKRELRRDPVEPPQAAEPGWREWLLAVTLNGRAAAGDGLFVEPPGGGGLAAQLALLETWRVRTDTARILTFEGEPYYPLDAIPGATSSFDRQALTLVLDLPPEAFQAATVLADEVPRPPPATGVGGFLDYDLLLQAGDDLDEGVDGLVELGAFGPPGTALSSFRLDDLAGDPEAVRLDTTLSRDVPASRTAWRLGDSIGVGGAFAAPVRFGGIQYATNFAVDPTFVTFPLPAIGGLARSDSVVDVLIDNLQRDSRSVPPGPFRLDNLPVVTGAGEVQLRVTDLLGREQLVSQPYYVSSRLLKPGLSDFSYEAGAVRRDYGRSSFGYGDPLLAATHRYGFTDRLTGEAHGELQLDQQSLVAGGSFLAGRAGVVSGGVGASTGKDGPGALGQAAYEYDGRRFNLGLRTRLASSGFRQAGTDREPARTDEASLGFDLDRWGRLGFLFLNRYERGGDDLTSLSSTYSLPVGPGALTLRAAQLVEPERELALTALYTVPLGPRRSATADFEKRGGSYRGRTSFRQTRGASDLGLDYRVGAGAGTDGAEFDARVSYQSRLGAADLEVDRFDGRNALRTGVNGSLALVDGKLAASRRVGRAFGLVDLPGFPDVRVYLDNREAGRTDRDGQLLLPGLRPFESNRVRLEVQDLPLDAELTTAEVEAVPFERSGVRIGFPVARGQQATATLRDNSGEPLPAGLRLSSADGAVTAWVARDGFTQVKGPLAGPVTVASGPPERPFACDLPAAGAGELLPDLGEVRCR